MSLSSRKNNRYPSSDRFISQRLNKTDQDIASAKLSGAFEAENCTPYNNALCNTMFKSNYHDIKKRPILKIRESSNTPDRVEKITKQPGFKQTLSATSSKIILKQSSKTRDVPLSEDFYQNPMAFLDSRRLLVGSTNNITLLENGAIIANARYPDDISAIQSTFEPNKMHVAGMTGNVYLMDIAKNSAYASWNLHAAGQPEDYLLKTTALDPHCFIAGSHLGYLYLFDNRAKNLTTINLLDYNQNNGKICGLSYNTENLIASGHNGNVAKIWDLRTYKKPVLNYTAHKGAIKALTFSPHDRNVIASGGGTADKKIDIWNIATEKQIATANSKSQVTGIHWLNTKQLVSTHGYGKTKIGCWNIKRDNRLEMLERDKINTDEDFNTRILYTAQNPKKPEEFVTAGSYQGLCFWKAETNWPSRKQVESSQLSSNIIR